MPGFNFYADEAAMAAAEALSKQGTEDDAVRSPVLYQGLPNPEFHVKGSKAGQSAMPCCLIWRNRKSRPVSMHDERKAGKWYGKRSWRNG